jgi:formylglycine-generating enzyme required for sulfatase activity
MMKRTSQKVAMVSIPLLGVSLLLGLLAIFPSSSDRSVYAQGEAVQIGQLRLAGNENNSTGVFSLQLEQMPAAPTGEHYELWMQSEAGELLRLGEFTVAEGKVALEGSTEESLLGGYNSVLISLEPDDDTEVESLTQVVLSSTLPTQLLTFTRQLLVSTESTAAPLEAVHAQVALVSDHTGFLVDSLSSADLTAARTHAEHIVNILDGESGDYFGDLNRDGQTQNPGDGIGVRLYLVQTHDLLDDMLTAITTTEKLHTQVQDSIAVVEDAQALVDEAREQALRIFAIDTTTEAQAITDALSQTVGLLTHSEQDAHNAALALVTYDFYLPPALSTLVSSTTISAAGLTTNTTANISAKITEIPPPFASTGETWTNPVDGGVYVYVVGGEATLGSDSDDRMRVIEQPQHTVEVEAFWMQQTEVTNRQYLVCMDQGGCTPPNNEFWFEVERADHPVTNVSWEQANTYAQWVGGRLPTEAEWERACQGPAEQAYPWGDAAPTPDLSNFYENVGDTVPVGSYPEGASPEGLLDMSGNVWEWTSSLDQPYPYDAQDGREDPSATGKRIGRGGSFYYTHHYLHCSARTGLSPTSQVPQLGFRVVISTAD